MPKLMDSSDSEEDEPAPARLPFNIQSTLHTITEGIPFKPIRQSSGFKSHLLLTHQADTTVVGLIGTVPTDCPEQHLTLYRMHVDEGVRVLTSQGLTRDGISPVELNHVASFTVQRGDLWHTSVDMQEQRVLLHSLHSTPNKCEPCWFNGQVDEPHRIVSTL